jgi:hypothetical protein
MNTYHTYSTKPDLLIKKLNHKNSKTSRKLTSWVLSGLSVEAPNVSSVEFSSAEAGEIYKTLSLHSSIALPLSLLNWIQ